MNLRYSFITLTFIAFIYFYYCLLLGGFFEYIRCLKNLISPCACWKSFENTSKKYKKTATLSTKYSMSYHSCICLWTIID